MSLSQKQVSPQNNPNLVHFVLVDSSNKRDVNYDAWQTRVKLIKGHSYGKDKVFFKCLWSNSRFMIWEPLDVILGRGLTALKDYIETTMTKGGCKRLFKRYPIIIDVLYL